MLPPASHGVLYKTKISAEAGEATSFQLPLKRTEHVNTMWDVDSELDRQKHVSKMLKYSFSDKITNFIVQHATVFLQCGQTRLSSTHYLA